MNFKVPFGLIVMIVVAILTIPPLFTFINQRLSTIETEWGDVSFDGDIAIAMINDIKKQTIIENSVPYNIFSLSDTPNITKMSSVKQIDSSVDPLPSGTLLGYEIFWSFDNIAHTEQVLYFETSIKLANTRWTQVTFYSGVGAQMKVFNIPPADGTANFFTFLYQTEIEREVGSIYMQYIGYNSVQEKNVFFSVYYKLVYTYTATIETTEETTEDTEGVQLEPQVTAFMNYPLVLLTLGGITIIIKSKKRKREKQ